jgi:hydroxymethylglutaryl-CoA lyase
VLQVDIREVGPRDGLQAEAPIAISDRVSLINQLISAGVRHIEVASFMRDDVVPSMAGAEEVIAAISERSGITVAGLVANLAGVRRALSCDLDEITITVSLSKTRANPLPNRWRVYKH